MPEVFERWSEVLLWLLRVTDDFPKKTRFTLVSRIQNLGLDVLDDLTIATWTSATRGGAAGAAHLAAKTEVLDRANLRLARLRVMLRLSRDIGHLSARQHEHAVREMAEVGRMLGGWRKDVAQRGGRQSEEGPGGG